jgi:hypothetical protein
MNPLTVEELLRLSREVAAKLPGGRRKHALWKSPFCQRGSLYVIDTAQIPVDPQVKQLAAALGREDPYPEDTLVVVMNPLDVRELRDKYLDVGQLFPVSDAWIAASMIDWMVVKRPELKERWGW